MQHVAELSQNYRLQSLRFVLSDKADEPSQFLKDNHSKYLKRILPI